MAAYFLSTLQQDSGEGDKCLRKMCDGHLVFDGTKLIMSSLHGFTFAETREVLFDNDTFFVGMFEECGVSWRPASGIVGYIDIFCTAITSAFGESVMIYGTSFGYKQSVFPFCFNGATEFDTVSFAFMPCAFKGHFKTRIADG